MPGPPPKRSDERRRRNVPTGGPTVKVDIDHLADEDPNSLPFLIKQDIIIPEPESGHEDDGGWHPIAMEMWESFKRSGQALFWEPSDWMMAKLFCESLSRDLKPQFVGVTAPSEMGPGEPIYERIPLKGASLGAYLKLAGQLMITEGERRRLSIELERTRVANHDQEPASVVKITDRRQARLVASERKAGKMQA